MENDRTAAPAPTPPPKTDKQDPRASLRNILADPTPTPPPKASPVQHAAALEAELNRPQTSSESTSTPAGPTLAPAVASTTDGASPNADGASGSQGPQNLAAITYTLRKNANGGVSTVYSGSKIKYLKKDDGLPFWRRDIQYTFLRHVFQDKTRVFTKLSTGAKGHTFAEVYLDAMAHSSKCSQILKEKLMSDTSEQAIDISMVCLLVNVGRMNTTVNFFPEMRARVRTFHSIPSLQTHQNPQAYKQLQDGPRLKSILKGAMEDTPQPSNLEDIANHSKPRTNPVSLIFVLAQYAPRVSDLHFPVATDFFDLFMRDTLSSKSRANALLWIVWWYLESDFTAEDALNNPFGSGRPSIASEAMLEGLNVMKGVQMRVPEFEILTEEEAMQENVDPPDELEYGESKRREREEILKEDIPPHLLAQPPINSLPPAQAKKSEKTSDTQTPKSMNADRSPRNSSVEPHSNRGYRKYTPSPARYEDRRYEERRYERMTPSPDRSVLHNRPQLLERESTRSGTPAPTVERRSSGGGLSSFKDTPDAELRKGPGRGNYPRRIKAHSTQPFEQMHHPDQFRGAPNSSARHVYSDTEHSGLAPSYLPGYPPPDVPQYSLKDPPAGYYYKYGSNPLSPPSLRQLPDSAPVEGAAPSKEPKDTTSSEQPPGQTSERPAPTKRGRQSERTRALEETRNDRISYIIDSNIQAIRKAKHAERKHRGVILDAWIKARSLDLINDMWDSDDEREHLERTGGLDDIRKEGIELSLSIPTPSGFESKKAQWNPGDMGQLSSSISRTFRKLARVNGVHEIVDRARRRTRGAEQENERRASKRSGEAAEDEEDMVEDDIPMPDDDEAPRHGRSARRQSPMASYPTSNYKRKSLALAPADRRDKSPGSVAAEDDAATVKAEPTPKKKRRVLGPRKMKLSAKASAASLDQPKAANRGPRGGRRPGAGAKPGRSKRKSESDAPVTGVNAATGGKGRTVSLSTRGGRGGRSTGRTQDKERGKVSGRGTRDANEIKVEDEANGDAGEGDVDMDAEVAAEERADNDGEGDSYVEGADDAEDGEGEADGGMEGSEVQPIEEDDTEAMEVDHEEAGGDGETGAAATTVVAGGDA